MGELKKMLHKADRTLEYRNYRIEILEHFIKENNLVAPEDEYQEFAVQRV